MSKEEQKIKLFERSLEALKKTFEAIDQGKMVPLGSVGGMTIEANIRGSTYFRVPAWPIEEARTELYEIMYELEELEKTDETR